VLLLTMEEWMRQLGRTAMTIGWQYH